jgi:hypothetical protein
MSFTATKAAPTYLREARLAAGFVNRGTASTEVPFSQETIGRHERGEVPVQPEDAMVYAKHYGREDILLRHCAECPVGKAMGRTVTDRDLPFATLRLTQRLRKAAQEIAATLESIADDGIVDNTERPDFDAALDALNDLGATIADIVLYAASNGIEKSRPANAETAISQQDYSITAIAACQSPKLREEAR